MTKVDWNHRIISRGHVSSQEMGWCCIQLHDRVRFHIHMATSVYWSCRSCVPNMVGFPHDQGCPKHGGLSPWSGMFQTWWAFPMIRDFPNTVGLSPWSGILAWYWQSFTDEVKFSELTTDRVSGRRAMWLASYCDKLQVAIRVQPEIWADEEHQERSSNCSRECCPLSKISPFRKFSPFGNFPLSNVFFFSSS